MHFYGAVYDVREPLMRTFGLLNRVSMTIQRFLPHKALVNVVILCSHQVKRERNIETNKGAIPFR